MGIGRRPWPREFFELQKVVSSMPIGILMPRVFEVYPTRRKISLEGVWALAVFDKSRKSPPPADSYTHQISVPGVWECLYELSHHRGFGWFRKEFFVAEEVARDAEVVFEAVSHTARVWLDGCFLGEHYGAHTAFSFLLKDLQPGSHVLEVEVDNRFGPCNPLTDSYQDIYTYGGIVRPVVIHLLPRTHLAEAAALPVWTKGGWALDVQGRVGGAFPKTVKFQLPGAKPVDLPVHKNGKFSARIPAGSIREWSPEDPALYTVSLTAGEDVWVERVGFRKIEIKGKQILLNGKPLNMVGVNRHEFHPDFGLAVPRAIHHRDMEILKDMGANFVRGSHYANDPFFLDLCDENGILFWEELGHWQPRSRELKDPAFLKASLTQLEEMVIQHRHHPCIVLWGMLNELDSDLPEARPVVGKLAKAFKALDPTRPVTYATRKPNEDICFDLVDVLSLNLYLGWY